MDNKDEVAKNNARKSRSNASRPGAQSVGKDEATRLDERIAAKSTKPYAAAVASAPGVHAVSGAEAARLDERIASKQRGSAGKAAKRQLNDLEADVTAKAKGRGGSAGSSPGAQFVSTDQASLLDARIAAKTAIPNAPGAHQASELDARIAAKSNQAGNSAATGAKAVGSEEASRLDARIAAKGGVCTVRHQEPESSGHSRASSRVYAAARSELNQLEDEVSAKARANGGRSLDAAQPGAREALNDFENSVTTKFVGTSTRSMSSNGDGSVVSRLDGRIDAKIRGAHVPTVLEDPTNDPEYRDGEMDRLNQHYKSDAPTDYEKGAIDEKGQPVEESAPPMVTAARGLVNEPDVEFGSYGGPDNEYANPGLAVAVAIADEEEEAFIPAAIQYDPDAKPPIYKNRRVRLYGFMACILLIVIVVGAAVGATSGSGRAFQPTLAPTTVRENLGIQAQITAVVGEEALTDPLTPQSKAMEWIINEDPAMLPPQSDNLIQRYLLALFYISTTQLTPWLSCNKPKEDEDNACSYKKLVRTFPNETYEEIDWIRWLSSEHECAWAGVFCDEFNQTRAIELPGQEIRGTFPTDITKMPYLQSFTLNWNEFFGTLPTEMAQMKHLLNIELHYNFFSGEIPAQWYDSQALQRVNVAANMLTGVVPTEIGQLSTMKGFFLFENMIKGTIPTEVGNMKFLSFTRWGRNFMDGTLPTELGKLAKLQELWMHRNVYTGDIPSEFGNLRDMGDMRIHFNPLTGTIPEEFYGMPQLNRFDGYNCNITGTISTKIGAMSNLAVFRVRANNLVGSIPTELGKINGLTALWLQLNDMGGSVPSEVCALRGPATLNILEADCRSDNTSAEPLMSCEAGCCTTCCDSTTGVCLST